MRRGRERQRGGSLRYPLTLSQIAALVSAMPWAHRYVMGDYSASAVPNRGSAGGSLALAAGTLAGAASDAKLSGQPSLTFSGTQRLAHSAAASAWRFLHDGTGMQVWTVYSTNNGSSTQAIWSTRTEFGGDVGASALVRSTQTSWDLTNASAAIINSNSGTVTQNVAQSSCFSYQASASPQYSIRHNGVAVSSGTPSGSPATGVDPSGPLSVGGTTAGILMWSGSIGEILIAPGPVSPYNDALVSAYITGTYGAPA